MNTSHNTLKPLSPEPTLKTVETTKFSFLTESLVSFLIMTWCRVHAPKRKASCLRLLAFSLFISWLVIFGFLQDETISNFGENLDRNDYMRRIQTSNKRKTTDESATGISHKKLLDVLNNSTPLPNIFGNRVVGEMGKPVLMPRKLPPEIQELVDEGWKKNSFNQYLSDLISVKRSLPDFRTDYCRNMETAYSKSLPATSVIIVFHNEAWSTLLR